MKVTQALKECTVFASMSEEELEKVASSVLEKQYEAGATILQEGDSAEEFLVLQEGKAAVQITLPEMPGEMSRRVTVDIVSRNEVVGWSALVEPYLYTFSVVGLQKVTALSISGTKLRWLIRDNLKIGYEVMCGLVKVIASRLDETRRVLISERLIMPKTE